MKHVYVGMSGGVDSSVAAALMLEQGYHVTGVYMKNWAQDLPGFHCPWQEDYEDAMRVAVQLGIELKLYDFQAEYRQRVVDYMIDGYQKGLTPNPDIMCNQEVKFRLFLHTALDDGADMIATGHYARIDDGRLLMGKDPAKDQSYFLYRVDKAALKKTIFPLGVMHKSQVRVEAKKRGLITADKKDSQGICFVGDVRIEEFLEYFIQATPGAVVDIDSRQVVGEHKGALYYTIGQRHGLGVAGGLPYYVVDKDMTKNEVYVTSDIASTDLWSDELELRSTHWIGEVPQQNQSYKVRIRHQGSLLSASVLSMTDSSTLLRLDEPVRAAAPGQSAVVYNDDLCLGGGIIAKR